MHDPSVIIESVLGVFLVIVAGSLVRQFGWLKGDSDKSLASLITNILLPAYFVHKIVFTDHPVLRLDSLNPPLWGFGITSCTFVASLIFAKRVGPKLGLASDSSQRSFALCIGICNFGFIPLPLAEQYYPDAVVDLILHNVGVNLALWSVGIAVINGKLGGGLKSAIISPPFLSVLIAISLKWSLGDIEIPASIDTALQSLGACAIPMGLILSGALMVDCLKEATWRGCTAAVLVAIGLRHLVFPIFMLTFAALGSASTTMRQVIVLQAAMPAAILPIVIVKLYDHDLDTATRVVVASSLFGVLSIPAWIAIGSDWL